jgi:hypothetical protein
MCHFCSTNAFLNRQDLATKGCTSLPAREPAQSQSRAHEANTRGEKSRGRAVGLRPLQSVTDDAEATEKLFSSRVAGRNANASGQLGAREPLLPKKESLFSRRPSPYHRAPPRKDRGLPFMGMCSRVSAVFRSVAQRNGARAGRTVFGCWSLCVRLLRNGVESERRKSW